MVIWSSLRPLLTRLTITSTNNAVVRRCMSGDHHRMFPLQPSRFQWQKFKDLLHFYSLLGLIPAGLIILYVNIFIGPATLSEIPEDYTPKHWEYYRHPITRFMARYILNNPQQDYEKYLHHIFEENEKRELRRLDWKMKEKMSERNDYQSYYYRPILAKYYRVSREAADYIDSLHSK